MYMWFYSCLIVCIFLTTLTEVFPCIFLRCKANARVKRAKTGHGTHSSQFLCCSMYFYVVLFIVCFVSFCVLFVCKCVLNYCHWVATQLQLNIYHIIPYHITWHIISYHISSYHISSYHISYHISHHINHMYLIYHISYHITSRHNTSYNISYHKAIFLCLYR
jgi:hypothetical protein